ncbi:hypothetical protein [Methylomonas sp. EFPC1]|uniref:hypothetical protein n=1 Tax=Methylomonas sp. EFPC1 TaxID=2812647 RepID=UPI001F079F93|nr:hypothetical protein [Methylomonas sp. EFPC1]
MAYIQITVNLEYHQAIHTSSVITSVLDARERYRGLAKNAARLAFLTAIANVLRGDAYERRSLIASEI